MIFLFSEDDADKLCDLEAQGQLDDCKRDLATILGKVAIVPADTDEWWCLGNGDWSSLLYQITTPRDLFWNKDVIVSVRLDGKQLIVEHNSGNDWCSTEEVYYAIDRECSRSNGDFKFADLLESIDYIYKGVFLGEYDLKADIEEDAKYYQDVLTGVKKLTGYNDLELREFIDDVDSSCCAKYVEQALKRNALDIEKLI